MNLAATARVTGIPRAPPPYTAGMAARNQPPALQLSWLDGEAVAWQPGRGVYGGNLHGEVARVSRQSKTNFLGSTRVVPFGLPDGRLNVMVQRLDATTLASLGELDALHDGISPSVAWFGALHRYATDLVRNGRVLPVVTHLTGRWWHCEWQPLASDVTAAAELLAAMPPAVAAAAPVEPIAVLNSMVDRLTRLTLVGRGWTPMFDEMRTVNARAARVVSRALISQQAQFEVPDDLMEAIARTTQEFGAMARRADGEPILRARLRLGLPEPTTDDANLDADLGFGPEGREGGDWPLTLEIVDADDRSRWCTADDVASNLPTARSLAREERFLPLLRQRVTEAVDAIATAVPELAEWLRNRTSTVSVDEAAAALEGIDPLAAVGIELVAPEKLVRRRTSARITAEPKEGDSSGRFGSTALVQWQIVVDDTPVSDEVLRRAAEEGANLIQVGGRWVQLDRAEARRALANLNEHRAEHQEMSALELLALAAELERELEKAGLVADDGATTTDVLQATGWVKDLLDGLPESEIHEGVVPEGFTATLRPYQMRGLGWLQFLHGLGLGGCLADDMGLGKTPTTLAHLAGLPGPAPGGVPAVGGAQLGAGDREVRAVPAGDGASRHRSSRRHRVPAPCRRARHRRHHVPGGGEGPRAAPARRLDHLRDGRGPGGEEPEHAHCPCDAGHQGRAAHRARRARPSRTG